MIKKLNTLLNNEKIGTLTYDTSLEKFYFDYEKDTKIQLLSGDTNRRFGDHFESNELFLAFKTHKSYSTDRLVKKLEIDLETNQGQWRVLEHLAEHGINSEGLVYEFHTL